MGEIDDSHHAKNQDKAHGRQGKKAAGDQSIYAGLQYDFQAFSPFMKNWDRGAPRPDPNGHLSAA
jgi:hypothetical protein